MHSLLNLSGLLRFDPLFLIPNSEEFFFIVKNKVSRSGSSEFYIGDRITEFQTRRRNPFGPSYKRIFFRHFQEKFEWGGRFMGKRRERVCSIPKHLSFSRFENINVLEALAKQRCVPIGKQNVYQLAINKSVIILYPAE